MTAAETITQEAPAARLDMLTLVRLWIAANQWEAIAQRESERRFFEVDRRYK